MDEDHYRHQKFYICHIVPDRLVDYLFEAEHRIDLKFKKKQNKTKTNKQ